MAVDVSSDQDPQWGRVTQIDKGVFALFDFRDIEDVRRIVSAGGFRAAAQRHGLSQSALSGRVAALEQRIGAPLFERTRKGARLTGLGRRFVEEASRLTKLRNDIVSIMAGEHGLAGTVRIGVSETVVHTLFGHIMAEMQARYPQVRFELDVDVSDRLAHRLVDDALDVSILLSDAVPSGALSEALKPIDLGWFARADDPLVSKHPVTGEQLRERAVVTFPRGTSPYRRVASLLASDEGPSPLLHGSAALSTCLHLISEGSTLGVLPTRIVENSEHGPSPRISRLDVAPELDPGTLDFSVAWFAERGGRFGAAVARSAREAD